MDGRTDTVCVCVCVCVLRGSRGSRGREGGLLVSPCYCSRCSGLRFSEGSAVLQAAEGSLLCPQASVTPRLYSLLLCYVSCTCAEIGKKMVCYPWKKKAFLVLASLLTHTTHSTTTFRFPWSGSETVHM